MDNHWATPVATCVAALIGAAALGVGAVWSGVSDGGALGVLLLSLAALGALWAGLTGLVLRPRLRADGDGVTFRGLAGTVDLPWAGLSVQARRTRRLGRDSVSLELDDGDRLLLLGRWELGAPPAAVAEALDALRPGGPR
ncbi:PH domain-containing protein [Tsukamurella soli]|uniref:PH domain-containing protein n=1 Tax=Tsukamurella soli TaxID=644556 RepID=UPI0031E59C68